MTHVAYIAFALAVAMATYFVLVRVGSRHAALALAVVLWAVKLAGIWIVDLEPPGEPSTWRDGTPLPTALVALGYFVQWGAWGAWGASLKLGRPGKSVGKA